MLLAISRAPRASQSEKSGKFTNQDNKFSARPRDLQPRCPEEASLLQPHSGQAAGAEVSQPTSSSENFLSQT